MPNCVTMPNFVAIGQTVVAISRFWIVQDGGNHNLGFLKFYIFNDPNGQEGRTASLVKIARTAAEIWLFFDFSRWRPPPSWILKFQIFNGPNNQVCRTASSSKISSKSVKPRPIYSNFSSSAILDLLCVCRDHPRRAFGGLYHCAKFG